MDSRLNTNIDPYAKEIKLPSATPNPSLKSPAEVKVQGATTEIFSSNVQNVRAGKIDPSLAQAHIEELKHTREESGITFNGKSIEKALTGGACSAVSLTFIDHFLKGMKELQKAEEDITTEDVIHVIQSLSSAPETAQPGNQLLNLEKSIRTLQAALNTIEVTDRSTIDAKSRKIQSLVESKGLAVTDRTSSFHVNGNSVTENFKHEIESLPQGVYLLRGIAPDKTLKKKEGVGHTTVFIQHRDCAFFFDPNKGAFFIPKNLKSSEMQDKIIGQYSSYSLSQFRFYKIEEKGDLPVDKKKLLLHMNYQTEVPDEQADFFLNKNIKKLTGVASISKIMDLAMEEKIALSNPSAWSTKFAIIHAKDLNLTLEDVLRISQLPQKEAMQFIVDSLRVPLSINNFLKIFKQNGEITTDFELQTTLADLQFALCNRMLKLVGSNLNLSSIDDLNRLRSIFGAAERIGFDLTSALKILEFSLDKNLGDTNLFLLMPLLREGLIGVDDLKDMEPKDIKNAMGLSIQKYLVEHAKTFKITFEDLKRISELSKEEVTKFIVNLPPPLTEEIESLTTHKLLQEIQSVSDVELQIALCNRMLEAVAGSDFVEWLNLSNIDDLTYLRKIIEVAAKNDFGLLSALKIFEFSQDANFVYDEHIPLLIPLLKEEIISFDDLRDMEPKDIKNAMGSSIQQYLVEHAKTFNITLADLYLCSDGNEQKLIKTLKSISKPDQDYRNFLEDRAKIRGVTKSKQLQFVLCKALYGNAFKSMDKKTFEKLLEICKYFKQNKIHAPLSVAIRISELNDKQRDFIGSVNSYQDSFKKFSKHLKKEDVVSSDVFFNYGNLASIDRALKEFDRIAQETNDPKLQAALYILILRGDVDTIPELSKQQKVLIKNSYFLQLVLQKQIPASKVFAFSEETSKALLNRIRTVGLNYENDPLIISLLSANELLTTDQLEEMNKSSLEKLLNDLM